MVRKVLMFGIAGVVLAAAIMVLLWRPGDDRPPADGPEVSSPLAPAPSEQDGPLDLPPQVPIAESDEPDPEEVDTVDLPAGEPAGMPSDPQDELAASTTDEPTLPEPLLPEPIGVVNITGAFFQDLAAQLVAGYHPPRSENNPESQGQLLLHFSALNRRYGLDLIGLEHQSPSPVAGREEIFRNLLQPEVLETIWIVFVPLFEQALQDALIEARRLFPVPGAEPVERGLSDPEQQEFRRLLSASTANMAQAVQGFVDHGDAMALTGQWLQAQVTAYAAHSRYQQAEAELRMAQEAMPADQVRILAERLERDAAAQGIMQAIAARELARTKLLAVYQDGPSRPGLSEGELIYLSEWLWRRIQAHPERIEPLRLLAGKLRDLSQLLRSEAS